ncbi:MAG: hypothetical protein OXR73_10740 [Myxococcales bacterium]|nr:hypothetical protein [Myxococcales bacterium]
MAEARARVAAAREENRKKMRAVGEGTVTKMKVAKDKLELMFEFTNKGDKPLSQAEGAIAFYDASDTLLKQIKVPFRQPIAPGKSVSKRGRFPIDKAEDGDVALAKAKLKDLTLKWMPRLYRFEDGTTMESD